MNRVEGTFSISKLQVMRDYLLARLAALGQGNKQKIVSDHGLIIPLAVGREFARMAAVKILAWVRPDGYPHRSSPPFRCSLRVRRNWSAGKTQTYPRPRPMPWWLETSSPSRPFPIKSKDAGRIPIEQVYSGLKRFMPAARPIREDESPEGGGDGYCIASSRSRWGELS